MRRNVRILPPISGVLPTHAAWDRIPPKTYGNQVRGTACRNTDEFPVPVREALIGLSVDF
jgi:hypothetical protein